MPSGFVVRVLVSCIESRSNLTGSGETCIVADSVVNLYLITDERNSGHIASTTL